MSLIPATSEKEAKPIVFYDGACPMCRKEIAHYRNNTDAGNINWIDISEHKDELEKYDLNYEDAMRRFHVMAPDGQFHVGAYGFVYMWSKLKFYRFISRMIVKLRITRVLNWAYKHFANWRIRRQLN